MNSDVTNYIPTAFAQLELAFKLYHYALEGKVDINQLDIPLTFTEGKMIFVLSDKIFDTSDDLLIALGNNVSVAFGAAAIALNRVREDAHIGLPDPIESEKDQFVALTYQIRNAFAHDISEPRWNINNRYKRAYRVGGVRADLTNLHEERFTFEHIGGPDALRLLYDYAAHELSLL